MPSTADMVQSMYNVHLLSSSFFFWFINLETNKVKKFKNTEISSQNNLKKCIQIS